MIESLPHGRRRVAITGLGLVSPLGHDLETLTESLRQERSGIARVPEWQELELRSQIAGAMDLQERIEASSVPRRRLDTMGTPAMYAVLSAESAIASAQLTPSDLTLDRCACLVGSGVGALDKVYKGAQEIYSGRARRVRPFAILQAMSSSCSAHVTQTFGVGGRSYSLSSACATSSHAIGHAFELIRGGVIDLALTGAGEAVDAITAGAFCALRGAVSTGFNDRPTEASRPFDTARDGFVLSSGGGVLVLEEMARARQRGIPIFGEVLGFGANSDAHDLVQTEPNGARAADCMAQALSDADLEAASVDYINAHATSTVVGDGAEVAAVRRVFGRHLPRISSTKSLNGHALGAAGVHELAHCIAMLRGGFLAASSNLENVAEEHRDVPFVRTPEKSNVRTILSNSFGFGGTNATLIVGSPSD